MQADDTLVIYMPDRIVRSCHLPVGSTPPSALAMGRCVAEAHGGYISRPLATGVADQLMADPATAEVLVHQQTRRLA